MKINQYSKEEIKNFFENQDTIEWPSDFLVGYYKTLALLVENNNWHPDYRGYIDDIWYDHYKMATKWNLKEYPDEDLFEDGELSNDLKYDKKFLISEVEKKILWLWRDGDITIARWEG